MNHSNCAADYAGYTTNAVNNILADVVEELRAFLKGGGEKGSAKHVELSNRVKTISTLACASH